MLPQKRNLSELKLSDYEVGTAQELLLNRAYEPPVTVFTL